MNQPETATIWTIVENSSHPEYGVVRIPFPIPRESYDSYIEQLQKMGMGDPLKQDCSVVSVLSDYSILKQLEIMTVNVDELDYLAKRLESCVISKRSKTLPTSARFCLPFESCVISKRSCYTGCTFVETCERKLTDFS